MAQQYSHPPQESTMNTTSNIRTAQQYREQARESGRRDQESWERSDTDGFLSQWALAAAGDPDVSRETPHPSERTPSDRNNPSAGL
jgi:hypothetical protein